MKQTGLLLLVLSFTVQLVHAQHMISPANRKLSPVLQNNRKLLINKQEQVFWLVASNIDSARKYFSDKKIPITIIREHAGGLLVVRARGGVIDSTVLSLPFIRFVDVPRTPHEELSLNLFDNSLNTINLVHSRYPNLNGNGLVVSVKENKPDTTDIDFRGRYIATPLSSNLISSHASYMCTIIAGGENSFYTGGGVVKQANIVSSNFESLLPDGDNVYKQYGVSVQNHSYGTGLENYYGADAAAYDASIVANPSLMHVFSSGNSGNLTSTGPYAGITNMANLTGSFKMAKNIITVGAADTFGNVSSLSSRGPAYDGRIKPELVAFGEDGSSGAAAHTSGAVLLLQQYYKEKNSGTLPAASLVKALLVNNADDRGTKGPDFLSGYGSLNAYNALRALVNGQYFSGAVTQGATQTFTVTVPANTRQLKLSLCYTDPAAAANAPKALVNDLDLELVNNGNGQVYLPWVLSAAPILDSLLKPAVRKKDSLNNTEQITLDNPSAGTYTIRIKGYAIPAGSQPFFVAWQVQAADQFQWQFPASVDYVKGGEGNLVRWTSSFSNITGLLEYSVDKGVSWQPVNHATLATGNVYWQAPETYSTALLRMTIGAQTFVSDTFTISTPPNVQVGFNCADSALLFWSKLPGVKSYAVYQLGEKYLHPLVTSADTSIVIRAPGDKLWYTVAPVINNNYQGMKAYTINFRTQGVDCYLKSFFVDLQNGNTGWLTASIGTLLNVKSITFEKLVNRQWQSLKTFQPVTSLDVELGDNNLTDGVNTYRVKIGLTNGLFITSEPQSIYYFLTTRYIIFPNPVQATSTLTVLMKEEPQNTSLLLFNTLGQKVWQQRLTQTAESIPLGKLKAGIYFVIIQKNGKREFTGRVMVR